MPKGLISASVDSEVYEALMQFKGKGGNISGLINSLLKQYFFGGLNGQMISKELIRIKELEERYKDGIKMFQEALKELQELKKHFEREQEVKNLEEKAHILSVIQASFEDEIANFEEFERRARRIGKDVKDVIEIRLSTIASNNKISIIEAWELFFEVFPELKGKL